MVQRNPSQDTTPVDGRPVSGQRWIYAALVLGLLAIFIAAHLTGGHVQGH